MLLPGSFDADVISPSPPPLAIFIILRYEDGVVEPRRWWCYRYSLYFMKTRKKKEEEKDCIGVSRLLRRISGPFTPLFINEIKVEIKNRGFSRAFNPGIGYRRRAEGGGDFPAYVSRRLEEGVGRIEGEDENLRAAVYYRDEGVV